MRRLLMDFDILPGGRSTDPNAPPRRTQLRGAVYALLGGAGHTGWTPWRVHVWEPSADGSGLRLELVWLPDHVDPEQIPPVDGEPMKFGAWQVRLRSIEVTEQEHRLAAVSWLDDHREATVHTRSPVSLIRELPPPPGRRFGREVEVPYPAEHLIIASLAGHWNSASAPLPSFSHRTDLEPPPQIPDDLIAGLSELATVSAHRDLASVREPVAFSRDTQFITYRRCFTGSFVLAMLEPDHPVHGPLFAHLLGWAQWSGVGEQVAAGLGAIRVEPGNTLFTRRGRPGRDSGRR